VTLAQASQPVPAAPHNTRWIGQLCCLQGLVAAQGFNGKWCHVESYDEASQRYVVDVAMGGGHSVLAKVKEENLAAGP